MTISAGLFRSGRTRLGATVTAIRAFFERHPYAIVPLFLVIYGVERTDFWDFARLSASPLSLHPNPDRQFLQSSPLIFFLGHPLTVAFGFTASFWIIDFAGLAFLALSLRYFLDHRYGGDDRLAASMLFATPLLLVIFGYLGKSDPFTLAFFFLFMAVSSPIGRAVLATFMVLSHRELGVSLLLFTAALDRPRMASAIAGAAVGTALIGLYHYGLLPSPPATRVETAQRILERSLVSLRTHPIAHVLLTFGPFWFCVLSAKRLGIRWWWSLGVALVFSALTKDFTRVFIILSLPLILIVIDQLIRSYRTPERRAQLAGLFSWLPFFALVQAQCWGSRILASRTPNLVHRLFG